MLVYLCDPSSLVLIPFFFFCLQILPTAQRLLDELLSSQSTAINTVCGAPGTAALTTQPDHNRQSENKLKCSQFDYLGGNVWSQKNKRNFLSFNMQDKFSQDPCWNKAHITMSVCRPHSRPFSIWPEHLVFGWVDPQRQHQEDSAQVLWAFACCLQVRAAWHRGCSAGVTPDGFVSVCQRLISVCDRQSLSNLIFSHLAILNTLAGIF